MFQWGWLWFLVQRLLSMRSNHYCEVVVILYDDGFFAELDDCYMVYITGRLGSGKTLFAVEIAERYLKRGYKLISQIACIWNDDVDTMVMDEHGQRKVVAIFDELGLYFRTSKSASSISSFARKQRTYLIFSGRKAPHADLCELTVQLWFDFMKWFLIPIKIWRYDKENGRKTYHGYIVQTAWWEHFGVYDTLDPGDNPEEVVNLFKVWTEEFFRRYKRKYKISDVEKGGGDDIDETSNEFAASVRKMGDATKELASVSGGKKRWWG